MLIVKVKKFGVFWNIPFEMTAKSARGGTVRYPSSLNRVNSLHTQIGFIKQILKRLAEFLILT